MNSFHAICEVLLMSIYIIRTDTYMFEIDSMTVKWQHLSISKSATKTIAIRGKIWFGTEKICSLVYKEHEALMRIRYS